MTILHDELEMVAGIGLVGAGQLEPEVLPELGAARGLRPGQGGKIIDPEDTGLVRVERPGCTVGRGGELFAEEIRHRQHLELSPRGKVTRSFAARRDLVSAVTRRYSARRLAAAGRQAWRSSARIAAAGRRPNLAASFSSAEREATKR